MSQSSLLLAWGNVFGVLVTPFQIWLLARPRGLRRSALLGSCLVLACCGLRCIPCVCSEHFRRSTWTLGLLHSAAIINAAAGPLAMGAVSRVSLVWFSEHERTTATGIANIGSGIGGTASFLLGPLLVPSWAELPHLLYLEAGLAATAVLLVALCFPDQPARAPSAAAFLSREGEGARGGGRARRGPAGRGDRCRRERGATRRAGRRAWHEYGRPRRRRLRRRR